MTTIAVNLPAEQEINNQSCALFYMKIENAAERLSPLMSLTQ
jgi:hypothetical protein